MDSNSALSSLCSDNWSVTASDGITASSFWTISPSSVTVTYQSWSAMGTSKRNTVAEVLDNAINTRPQRIGPWKNNLYVFMEYYPDITNVVIKIPSSRKALPLIVQIGDDDPIVLEINGNTTE